MMPSLTILEGDWLEQAKAMLQGGVIQRLALRVKPVSVLQNARIHYPFTRASALPSFWVLFASPEFQKQLGIGTLYNEVRQERLSDIGCYCVRCLPAKQWPASIVFGWTFKVVSSAKGFRQQFYRSLMHHTKLKPLVINEANGVLSACSFDSNVPLSVNQSGKIG